MMPAMKRPRSAQRHATKAPSNSQPGELFLEALYAVMCRKLYVLPGETFVDQVARWMHAWQLTAQLKPRNEQEWLQAANLTMKQYAAVHCLLQRRRPGLTQRQRSKLDEEFLGHAKAMHDARLRYDLLRGAEFP